MTVLIVSPPEDVHAAHVAYALRRRGAGVGFLDGATFPSSLRISYYPRDRQGRVVLTDGRSIAWENVTSLFWRKYEGVGTPALPDDEQYRMALRDSKCLFETVLIEMPVKCVNSWESFQVSGNKPTQLRIVAALDLGDAVRVPATLVTNDPDVLVPFVETHPHCIFKPVNEGAYARRLRPEHLDREVLDNLRVSPVTIQEEIAGVDIRVYVAGDQVFAGEIQAQTMDFREDPQAQTVAVKLPDAVEQACVKIAAALKLHWTGIDLRRTSEGEYMFFEANSSPAFIDFERRTQHPLTEALLSLLIP